MREPCENCGRNDIEIASQEAGYILHVCPVCSYCDCCGNDEIGEHYDDDDCTGEC